MLSRGEVIRGIACYAHPVIRKFKATVASGVSTKVAGECDPGISAGTFTNGAITFTFSPRPKKVSFLWGHTIESATDRLRAQPTSAYSVSAGTLAVNFRADDDGADEGPADTETYEVFFLCEEGSS